MISSPYAKFTLKNGLRVVVAPDHSAPVVAVSVHYHVGYRSEPEDRSGFAHLFEHLMFGGSESVPKLEHPRLVKSSGGMLNGTTLPDFTMYFEVVPTSALDMALFLEADRMRAPLLTEAELNAQVGVVKEEILTNVASQPYGRYPDRITEVLYTTFANTHDGYGDFASLEKATLDDCADFFDKYYGPGNAVLTVTGDVTAEQAEELVRRHFSDVPGRPVPARPSFDEPTPTESRRTDVPDPQIPLAALALGYRMPDPTLSTHDYLAYVVLSDILTTGENSRLLRRIVHGDQISPQVTAMPLHQPFFAGHPDTFCISALLAPGVTPERVMAAVDEEVDRLAQQPPTLRELSDAVTRWKNGVFAQWDDPFLRVMGLGLFELLHGDAQLLSQMPDRLDRISADDVADAAKQLCPDRRAVLTLQPSGAPA